MSDTQQQLDVLLRRAREASPVVSLEDTRAFLHKRLHGQTGPYATKPRISSRPIIVTGGLMAVLTFLFFLLRSIISPSVPVAERSAAPQPSGIEQTTRIPADDHTEQGLTNLPSQADTVSSRQSQSELPSVSEGAKHGNVRASAASDSLERRHMHEAFASWTKERIEGYTVYEFDAATLSRIGITIDEDGTIIEEHGGLRIGMREQPHDGSVLYYFMGLRPATPKDSVVLLDPRPKSNIQMQLTDSTVDEPEWCECNAVLITNSRGRTYGHTYSSGSPNDPDAVGSGKFKNGELVPVRLPAPADLKRDDESEFFYLFWYEPTGDFLAVLPPDIRIEIQQRLNRLRGTYAAPPLALAEASVYPNPATSDMVTVDYTLKEERRIAVSVYDITGVHLRDVAVTDTRASGNWKDAVSFEGIPNGYYLLAVTTDKGEQSVRPFILNR